MSTAAKTSPLAGVRNLAPLVEIAVAYGLIEGALWTPGHARHNWAWAALAWIIGVTLFRRPSLRELGLRWSRMGWWIAGAAVVFAGAAVLAAASIGTLHDYSRNGLAARAASYLVWSCEQEFILQSFIFTRLETLLGDGRRAVIAAVVLFAAAHIPSPVLTAGTLLMAYVFCELFRRNRNLYPLAAAHWIVGLALSVSLPDWLSHHMRVGIGYWHYLGH